MSMTQDSLVAPTVRIAGKPYQLQLELPKLRETLDGLGHSGALRVEWTTGINPGEYYQEDEGKDVVCLNPHFIVLLRLGLIPLPWPTAFCPLPLYKKRLLQTLAHELRHAQQTAGLTAVSDKEPWLSYVTLRNIGRGYIVLALVGALSIQQLLQRDALMAAQVVIGVLMLLAVVYIILAYRNYHLDPMEVDARAYERSNWQDWEACLTFLPKS
jgi:hypothetical protein